jgi:alpha-galactosidase
MKIETLQATKKLLVLEVGNLVIYKNELFKDVDITQPMSDLEKQITKRIADLYSQINQLVKEINKLK